METSSTSTSLNRAALAKLNELIKDIDIAMLTTVTDDGSLRSRPMGTQGELMGDELFFFTADNSGKTAEIAREHEVNLAYADPKAHRYVSITGRAHLLHDRERMRSLWKPVLKAWFPQGLDDPHLALLVVRIDQAEYWDSSQSKMMALFEMAKAALGGGPAKNLGEHEKLSVRPPAR